MESETELWLSRFLAAVQKRNAKETDRFAGLYDAYETCRKRKTGEPTDRNKTAGGHHGAINHSATNHKAGYIRRLNVENEALRDSLRKLQASFNEAKAEVTATRTCIRELQSELLRKDEAINELLGAIERHARCLHTGDGGTPLDLAENLSLDKRSQQSSTLLRDRETISPFLLHRAAAHVGGVTAIASWPKIVITGGYDGSLNFFSAADLTPCLPSAQQVVSGPILEIIPLKLVQQQASPPHILLISSKHPGGINVVSILSLNENLVIQSTQICWEGKSVIVNCEFVKDDMFYISTKNIFKLYQIKVGTGCTLIQELPHKTAVKAMVKMSHFSAANAQLGVALDIVFAMVYQSGSISIWKYAKTDSDTWTQQRTRDFRVNTEEKAAAVARLFCLDSRTILSMSTNGRLRILDIEKMEETYFPLPRVHYTSIVDVFPLVHTEIGILHLQDRIIHLHLRSSDSAESSSTFCESTPNVVKFLSKNSNFLVGHRNGDVSLWSFFRYDMN